MQINNTRVVYLDILKVMASFGVVFYHYSYYKVSLGAFSNDTFVPSAAYILLCFAACSIPLFFMINGCLTLSQPRQWAYCLLKVMKCATLYLLWSFAKAPVWFLMTLGGLYFVTPFIQRFITNKTRLLLLLGLSAIPLLWNALVLILCTGFGISVLSYKGISIPLQTSGFFTAYACLYYILGKSLGARRYPALLGWALLALGTMWVLAEGILWSALNGAPMDCVNAAFPTVGALLQGSGCFVILNSKQPKSIPTIIQLLSRNLMPIYLLHIPVMHFTRQFYTPSTLVPCLLMSGAIMLICALLGELIRRIPYIRWLIKL